MYTTTEVGVSYILTFINYFLSELFPRLDSPSPLHCASLCSLNSECQSVFYQPASRACVPVHQVYSTTEGLRRQSGWQYFVKKEGTSKFKVLLVTGNESAIYDLNLQEWSPFHSKLPEYSHDISFDGGDDVILCWGRQIDLVSLKTGTVTMIGDWPYTEYINAIEMDLQSQWWFYATIVDVYELHRMHPRETNSSEIIHSSNVRFVEMLTLDRDRKIVFATGYRDKYEKKDYWTVSMRYDGSEATNFTLSSEEVKDMVFDRQDNALLYTAVSGVYSYNVATKKKVKIFSGVSSPKQIDIFRSFVAIVDENRTSSRVVIISRRGEVLYELKSPIGPNSEADWHPSQVQILY